MVMGIVIPLVATAQLWHILVQLDNAITALEGFAFEDNSSHIRILLDGMVSHQVTPQVILWARQTMPRGSMIQLQLSLDSTMTLRIHHQLNHLQLLHQLPCPLQLHQHLSLRHHLSHQFQQLHQTLPHWVQQILFVNGVYLVRDLRLVKGPSRYL
jgi:hypothetical protein